MMRSSIAAALFFGAGLSSAQTISSGCRQTLLNMLGSPAAQCLNPSALLSLATASPNASVISPVDNWLTGLCAQAPCTNSSLSAVVTNITSGCSTELSSFGVSISNPSQIINIVEEAYPTIRQAACLKDNSASKLCATELLTDIQASVGTLSITSLVQIIPNLLSGSASIPQTVTCSDCVKQTYNVVQQNFPGLLGSGASSALGTACGSAFTNGATPTEISQSASTASPGTNSKASTATSLLSASSFVAVVVSTLIAVSSAFVVLA
jgi:hypothetical protein